VKLSAHSAGLPGNDLLFNIVPLNPAYKAGLKGHAPAKQNRHAETRVVHHTDIANTLCTLESPDSRELSNIDPS